MIKPFSGLIDQRILSLVMKPYDSSSSPGIDMAEMKISAVAQVGQKRSRKGGLKKGKGNGNCGDGGDQSEHEMHIWTERERRKKMRNMFSSLHSLLPQLPAKADKSTIVDEAVTYIKALQQTLQALQKQKLEKLRSSTVVEYDQSSIITSQVQGPESREAFLTDQGPRNNHPMTTDMSQTFPAEISPACFQTLFSPNVVLNMSRNDAQISVCSPRKPGILATILYILEKHRLEVVSAHISSDQYRSIFMIHVHAGAASDQFSEALSVEETFKLAAGEMNLWLLSC